MCVACHPSEVAIIAGGTFAGIGDVRFQYLYYHHYHILFSCI